MAIGKFRVSSFVAMICVAGFGFFFARAGIFSFAPVTAQENAASSAVGVARQIQADIVYGHKDGLAMTMDVLSAGGRAESARRCLFMVSGGWYSRWAPPEQTKFHSSGPTWMPAYTVIRGPPRQ
jgi:hypothetical protein